MRKEKIIQDEYYHIINRGNNKQLIFKDERDRAKFLFSILHFQSPAVLPNIHRQIDYFIKNNKFNVSDGLIREIAENRNVELVAFILMPNHFHLIVKEHKENGISTYMQRVLTSHSKYSNAKYEISGHLFQGTFKSIHIEDDPQLLYLSAYIHNNVKEVRGWNKKEYLYPWSSFQDFVEKNRWGELLKTEIILDQLSSKEKYKIFVQKSGAKDKKCSKLSFEHYNEMVAESEKITENGFTLKQEKGILKAAKEAEQGINVSRAMSPKELIKHLKGL